MRASANRIEGRAVYVAVTGKRVVIVLAFEKKTQKTPRRFINQALDRMKRIES
jgi:phage-related protein